MGKIVKTDREWQTQLSPLAYKITRKHGTERAFTNDNFPKIAGEFHCICCDTPLFDQSDKFDSGTGWPSFTRPIPDAPVGESQDNSWFMRRTEVHCKHCDAHLAMYFLMGPSQRGCAIALTVQP